MASPGPGSVTPADLDQLMADADAAGARALKLARSITSMRSEDQEDQHDEREADVKTQGHPVAPKSTAREP